MSQLDPAIRDAVRDGMLRACAIVGLAAMAAIHLVDAPGTFSDTPYLGWLYVGLILSSIGLAAALVRSSDDRLWAGCGALAAAVIVGYSLSRTTGLPADSGDVGNWSEPLGLASLFVEGALVALASGVLVSRRALAAAPAALGLRAAAATPRRQPARS
jgi:hypothetical protein